MERSIGNLNMKGIIINSHTMGEYLDDPKYWAIFEAAESLGAPIYLHPREPAPGLVPPYLDYGLYCAGWGFAAEAGLHAMRLIMCGVFDRFPKLKIILGHMGEGIPFWLQRIDNRYLLQVKIGMVLELAVAARCDYIVTYNQRDFSGADTFGIRVMDARTFLQEIGELP